MASALKRPQEERKGNNVFPADVTVDLTMSEADILIKYISVSLEKVKAGAERQYRSNAPDYVQKKTQTDMDNLHSALAKLALALVEES